MLDLAIRNFGLNKGKRRLYMDMPALARAGFKPHSHYEIESVAKTRCLTLRVDHGKQGPKVVRKASKGREIGVIDLNSDRWLAMFRAEQVRIEFSQGVISIRHLATLEAQFERVDRLMHKLKHEMSLAVASVAHGIGLMSSAGHEGLGNAGIKAHLACANELDSNLMDHARAKNPIWKASTVGLNVPLQELARDKAALAAVGTCDIMEVGIPCSGASKAGRAKAKTSMMEMHPHVGHLVVPIIELVNSMQPAVAVFECVVQYRSTASAQLLRMALSEMGYRVEEATLRATDFGSLEGRDRWFMVAHSQALGLCLDLSVDEVIENRDSDDEPCLGSMMDEVAEDDPCWKPYVHLFAKAQSDQASGKSFRMQFIDERSRVIPTLRKGYNKAGSTDPLVKHPTKQGLYRLLTPLEHARIKGHAPALIEDMGVVKAHEALGQGVDSRPVSWLFRQIGNALRRAASTGTPDGKKGAVPYKLHGTG